MPTRVIRDGILTSERINSLSPHAELFYRRLMSVADDHGRYSGNLTLIRSACYPLKVDSVKEDSIKKHLAECVDAGLVVPYTVDNKPFIVLLDFGQRINGKSRYPEPPETIPGESRGIPGNPRLDEGVDEGVGEGGKGASDPLSGVDAQVAKDFRKLRSALKAPITETAIAGIKREAEKCGLTLDSALQICVERNWRGFRAEWMQKNGPAPARVRREL